MAEADDTVSCDVEAARELLRAAGMLLNKAALLDAVYVLHAETARCMGAARAEGLLGSSYASQSEARRQHLRLLSACQAASSPQLKQRRLAGLWHRRPAWTLQAATAVVLVGLTLRYVWAVSDPANWARQNPEGNWISRYYPNPRFEGFPLVRYDIGVAHDFGSDAPAKSMVKDGFSATWDTCVVVTKDVSVPLRLLSDDGSTLLIDGVPQIQIEPGPGQVSAAVLLRQGLRHLSVQFVELEGMALIRLEGLELQGTDEYRFQRPLLDGERVRCE